ncbi:efflux RND transporter periplasmic adaptor subunit [Alkalilimnicola ehrlichii]|uniref:efflux RND transporter periplasmic adaptor subunit n=1 Tax=Alkalilimnicola ehrlichii TaxID=351052 RepID=UPI003BA2FB1A
MEGLAGPFNQLIRIPLLRIDPSRYEFAEREARAELASLRAERRELDDEERNTRRLLALEQRRLDLAEQELDRVRRLAERGAVSSAQRDEQERVTLQQEHAVQSLQNQLLLFPARRERLEAQRARTETRLDHALQDLADTRFFAPYDLRVHDVEVERHQHVNAGQRLFRADNIAAAELTAHVPVKQMRRLLGGDTPPPLTVANDATLPRVDLSGLEAKATLVGVDGVVWPAQVKRVVDGLDPQTRTARVVLQVDHPYRQAQPPVRPPLVRGMYLRAELSQPLTEPRLVIPAHAVHRDEVHLVNEEDRLQRRAVSVAFWQEGLAVLAEGLAPGDRVVVDDVVPAIGGMLLDPRRDEALEASVRERAEGTQP